MLVDRNVITAGTCKLGRDLLFDRVSLLEFADKRHGAMRVEAFRLGRVKIGLVESSGHVIRLSAPGEVSFLSLASGRLRISSSGARLNTGSGGAVFVKPGDRETAVGPDARGAYRAIVALAPMRRRESAAPSLAAPNLAAAPAIQSLNDLLVYLRRQALSVHGSLSRPAARTAAEALVLDGFAALDEADALFEQAADAVARRRVRLACDFIAAHADEPLTVAEIAGAAGLGARALQGAFRAVLGKTPRAVLSETRLDRARARLQSGEPGVSVADAAYASGFVHLGRFAAAYRLRFGEAPSETLRGVVGPERASD